MQANSCPPPHTPWMTRCVSHAKIQIRRFPAQCLKYLKPTFSGRRSLPNQLHVHQVDARSTRILITKASEKVAGTIDAGMEGPTPTHKTVSKSALQSVAAVASAAANPSNPSPRLKAKFLVAAAADKPSPAVATAAATNVVVSTPLTPKRGESAQHRVEDATDGSVIKIKRGDIRDDNESLSDEPELHPESARFLAKTQRHMGLGTGSAEDTQIENEWKASMGAALQGKDAKVVVETEDGIDDDLDLENLERAVAAQQGTVLFVYLPFPLFLSLTHTRSLSVH